MLFSLLYLILRRLLATGHQPEGERDIELLLLRHQVKVLRRQVKQVEGIRFETIGAVSLKGIASPVTLHQVNRAP